MENKNALIRVKRNFKIKILCVILMVCFFTFNIIAGEFYVSSTGSDTTGNGSISTPWRTVSFALQSISPTQSNPATVNINAGDFVGTVTMKDYTTLKGGWDLNFTQHNPAVNKTNLRPSNTSQNLIICSGTNILTGLILKNALNAVYITSGNLTISSCEITGNSQNGISILTQDSKVSITNSSIKQNPNGIYIYIATDVTITNNIFSKNTDKAIYSYFYSTPKIEGNTFDGNVTCVHINRDVGGESIISKNKFYKNTSNGVYLYRSASKVENNVFILNESGIVCDTYSGAAIFNNTFLKNRSNGISLNFSGSDLKIVNNIFYQNTKYGIAELDTLSDPTLRHNCFYENQLAHYLDGSTTQILTLAGFAAIENGSSVVVNNIINDPIINTDITDDFHISYGSPCIDAGDPTGAPTTDFDNESRPNDINDVDNNGDLAEIDIGCDEYYWKLTTKIIRDYLLGKIVILPSFFPIVDINHDGKIDIADLVLLINTDRK